MIDVVFEFDVLFECDSSTSKARSLRRGEHRVLASWRGGRVEERRVGESPY